MSRTSAARIVTGTARIVVKGKNIEVTPALRTHAEKKVRKLHRFLPRREFLATIVLGTERERQSAEVTLQGGGLLIRGEARTDDMYASIDAAAGKVEQQIRRFKTAMQKRLQNGRRLADLEWEPEGQTDQIDRAPEAAPVEEQEGPRLVRTKRFAFKPMDVEEALLQMELLGHDFYVFVNAATEQAAVVYRRHDGNYGLIEPEG